MSEFATVKEGQRWHVFLLNGDRRGPYIVEAAESSLVYMHHEDTEAKAWATARWMLRPPSIGQTHWELVE